MALLQVSADRYQRASKSGGYASINPQKLAFVVGLLAFLLPTATLVGVFYQEVVGNIFNLPPACFRDSISHSYYSPFLGSIFIGILIFIGGYLLVYQGEDDKGAERRLSGYAGIAAIGVALFPTRGHGCDDASFLARPIMAFTNTDNAATPLPNAVTAFELFPFAHALHYLCAGALFVFLAWFALFVFTAADPDQRRADGSLKQTKIIRNVLYYVMGSVMAAAVVGLIASFFLDAPWWNEVNLTFWIEAAALWAFGVSWMVKGRFLGRWIGD